MPTETQTPAQTQTPARPLTLAEHLLQDTVLALRDLNVHVLRDEIRGAYGPTAQRVHVMASPLDDAPRHTPDTLRVLDHDGAVLLPTPTVLRDAPASTCSCRRPSRTSPTRRSCGPCWTRPTTRTPTTSPKTWTTRPSANTSS